MHDEFLKARYDEAIENPVRKMDLVEIIGSLEWIYQYPKSLKAGTIGHEAIAQGAEVLMRVSNESIPNFYKVDVFREEWDKGKRGLRNAAVLPNVGWRYTLYHFIGKLLGVSE